MPFYRTDIPETASELFDGELVIADYGSGLYYAVSVTGSLIWQGLRHGLADHEVVRWLAGHFTSDSTVLPGVVATFISQLLDHRLLIAVPSAPPGPALPVLASESFAMPSLERFEDLQELLLLDPVHDVDETGWPRRASD